MLHIILAESPIELIPRSISGHRVVVRFAARRRKKPEQCLLDSNFHYRAMKELHDYKRRGRPDIVHITLLCLLSSPLNLEGKLKCYVHTQKDEVIFIDPKTRLPRSYNRFVGLVEQVLLKGETKGRLLYRKNMDVRALIEQIKPSSAILMDEKGDERPKFLLEKLGEASPCIIIGTFPHGDFRKDYSFVDARISIFRQSLDVWAVACKLLCLYELVLS